MPRKCSVYGCRSGYNPTKKTKDSVSDIETEKVTVHCFPSDKEECQKWIDALPNANLKVENITQHVGVCAKHWPSDVPKINIRGKYRPSVPPSCFSLDIPKSAIPTAQDKPRPTSKALSSARNPDIDQTREFLELDRFATLTFDEFHNSFSKILSTKGNLASNISKTEYVLISAARDGPVFDFTIIFNLILSNECHVTQVHFEAYCKLKAITVPYGDQGYLSSWSQLSEVLRYVSDSDKEDKDNKFDFILRQIQLMNSPKNTRIYDHNDLCQAFSWYARSRALYSDLRNHMQLPSLTTLRRITRASKNISDAVLYSKVFDAQKQRSRNCILIIDEVYIKSSVTYSGGVLFGYSEDKPTKLANTLLCIMVKCMFSSKKFLAKLVPCHALTAAFQYEIVCNVISLLENCGATVLVIINDNNRVNQSFFKLFPGWSKDSPYKVKSPSSSSPLFLLYDPVHIIKNVRNNWITEKTQSLIFPSNGARHQARSVARWSDIRDLYKLEVGRDARLSNLTKSTVYPSSMEKQKVSLVLNVFCDSTVAALQTSECSTESWKYTAQFISIVVKLWKLLNCKSPYQDVHFCDPDRIVIDNGEKGQRGLQTLLEWANIACVMNSVGSNRIQSLTQDTSSALQSTCVGLAALCEFLLMTESSAKHEYVCLGFFQQDDIERHFGHFRRSAGCNYFITACEVFSTHGLDRAKLMLSVDIDVSEMEDSHQCDICTAPAPVNDAELLILDEMTNEDVNKSISHDQKMAIFYIAGYVAFKHKELSGSAEDVSTEVKAYFNAINRKNLTQPSEAFLLFMLLAYLYFARSQEVFCRQRLATTLAKFPDLFSINIAVPRKALLRISNILLNNFRKKNRQNLQEGDRKRAKLTSQSLSSC